MIKIRKGENYLVDLLEKNLLKQIADIEKMPSISSLLLARARARQPPIDKPPI